MNRLLLLLLLVATPASADVPIPTYPECGFGGACPQEFHPWHKWNLSSQQPEEIPIERIPEAEREFGSGLWADKAWSLTTGRTDVVIAVLDSGIEWDHGDLVNKHFLNRAELPLPQTAAGDCADYDCNGDGVFNMLDWAEDPRLDPASGINATSHPDSRLDPSDLIAAFSDGTDADGNGYIDDISGWDFFWNDNNPYDDTRYGHGTGEARDSAAEGNSAGGDIGTCPNCLVMSLRVGDSFVADTNNFANAAIYAVDMGVEVIQEALGVLNNTPHTVNAIEYAWERGTTIIASAADETAYHHNYPANNHHTVYTHAIRYDTDDRDDTRTWFAYSNCTNYGGRLVLSAPSTSCSSGAVGVTSGVAGLIYSAMADQLDAGVLTEPLTSNEVLQILAQTTDDIAFVQEDHHPDYYPSYPGWDRYFGYGRVNAFKAVQAVYDNAIPPQADLLTPEWFEVLDLNQGTSLEVIGLASARASSYSWELQVGAGLDPKNDEWTTLATGEGTEPTTGVLATIDLNDVPVDPDHVIEAYTPDDDNVTKTDKVFAHGATLRLQVTDSEGRLGEMRKTLFVQRDPDLLQGFPKRPAISVDGSPRLVDVDGDGLDDVVWVGSDGSVHVGDWTLADKPGWPQRAPLIEELDPDDAGNHLSAPAYASDLAAEQRHAMLATPAVADLDGDGQMEIVQSTLNGALLAWHADGSVVAGFPFWLDRSLVDGQTDPDNVYDYGFFASPALGDLDGDGDLEIVLGAMDSRVYALHHDGSMVAGFPVELRETFTTSDGPRSAGERIVSSAALGDADGDGDLEIAIGTNQKTTGTYGLGYLLHHDGTIVDGWPVALFGAYTNALPYVGEGVPGSPTMCDIDGDGALEIAMHTIADSGKLLRFDGESIGNLARIAPDFGPLSNTDENAANLIMINSGAWGDLDADGVPDYAIGSTGFGYANGLLDDGQRYDHDHLLGAWSGVMGEGGKFPFLTGFPQVMEDLQFFLNPSIADIDGDGLPEAINGSAGHIVHAFNHRGTEPVGWPKNAGQWILGSPAVGDADGDGFLEVWTATRTGFVYAWRTTAIAETAYRGWTGFRHDAANTGNCTTSLRSYPPIPVEEPGCVGCTASLSRQTAARGGALLAMLLCGGWVRRRKA